MVASDNPCIQLPLTPLSISTLTNMASTNELVQQCFDIMKREDERLLRQGNGIPAVTFAKDVKMQLFQYDCAELLSATPISVLLIKSCYVAAFSTAIQSISLKDAKPTKGFKHLSYELRSRCIAFALITRQER
jgi:hypothetical protein